MRLANTTGEEDRLIEKAAEFGGLANDLIEIIERLDAELEKELNEKTTLGGRVSELESELNEYQNRT